MSVHASVNIVALQVLTAHTHDMQLCYVNRRPATEADLDDAEQKLGCKLPAALRVLYLLHNGQNLLCDAAFPELTPHESMFHGLPGG